MKKLRMILILVVICCCIGVAMAADSDTLGSPKTSYSKYYYLFCPGTMSVTELPNTDVAEDRYYGWGHRITLIAGGGSYRKAWVHAPLVGFASISGTHPRIRYMTFQVKSSDTVYGWPFVDYIHMYNGKDKFKESDVNWYSIGGNWREWTYDMGSYYDFSRGLSGAMEIKNPPSGAQTYIEIGGYGAKMEYN